MFDSRWELHFGRRQSPVMVDMLQSQKNEPGWPPSALKLLCKVPVGN